MTLIRDLLKTKGQRFWSTAPDSTVLDALKILAEKNIGALLVLDNGKVVGVFSERDYVRKIASEESVPNSTQVRELMSPEVLYLTPAQSLDECMAFMTSNDIRHLPVLDNNKLAGIISIGDVVNASIANKNVEITQLENFITGLLHVG
ncbi:MAG: CBS domain-containing protein [Fidelibacterota bacterium]|nr:MAG: CBS domain-containing protein [Candidatus Neomarinimicrobiota bacterium]